MQPNGRAEATDRFVGERPGRMTLERRATKPWRPTKSYCITGGLHGGLSPACPPALFPQIRYFPREVPMTKPHRSLKKANHGARPANSKARKMKRKHIRT